MPKRVYINNRIKADKVRLISPEGKQLGVFNLSEALKKAYESKLDLVKITENVEPPVCKIMDFGKYLYQRKKKERKNKITKTGELKNIRLGFNISSHDIETRVKSAEKFLKKGSKVRVEMRLRGREKALGKFAEQKIEQFLEKLKETTQIKVEKALKREPRGLTMIISK